jgi:hypothetical protein
LYYIKLCTQEYLSCKQLIINKLNIKLNELSVMPKGDRTGSMGQGPRTGRGLGFCEGSDSPGITKGVRGGMGRGFGYGRGKGMGRGMGRGLNSCGPSAGSLTGNPRMSSMSKEDEVKLLKSQVDTLRRSQKDIEKRLGELENEE